jgi:hypothetical protein
LRHARSLERSAPLDFGLRSGSDRLINLGKIEYWLGVKLEYLLNTEYTVNDDEQATLRIGKGKIAGVAWILAGVSKIEHIEVQNQEIKQ